MGTVGIVGAREDIADVADIELIMLIEADVGAEGETLLIEREAITEVVEQLVGDGGRKDSLRLETERDTGAEEALVVSILDLIALADSGGRIFGNADHTLMGELVAETEIELED